MAIKKARKEGSPEQVSAKEYRKAKEAFADMEWLHSWTASEIDDFIDSTFPSLNTAQRRTLKELGKACRIFGIALKMRGE